MLYLAAQICHTRGMEHSDSYQDICGPHWPHRSFCNDGDHRCVALKLKSEGVDLADFGAGEPHFNTPRHIKDAAIEAIEKNFTRYTNVAGTPEIRRAIVDRHSADFGSQYTPEECVFTTGGKLALFNAIQVLVDHGDEVILPAPLLGVVQRHHSVCGRNSGDSADE